MMPGCSKLRKDECNRVKHCHWVQGRKPGCVAIDDQTITNKTSNKTSNHGSNNALKKIPDHVQQHIWNKLNNPKNLERMRATSKQFRSSVPDKYKALINPIIEGFAKMIDGNGTLHASIKKMPLSEYQDVSFEITSGLQDGIGAQTDDSVGANGQEYEGSYMFTIEGASLQYSFKTRKLRFAINTDLADDAFLDLEMIVPNASGQDLLDIFNTESIVFELDEDHDEEKYTMAAREFFTLLLMPPTTPGPGSILTGKTFEARIMNPTNVPAYIPSPLYKGLAKIGSSKVNIDGTQVQITNAGNLDKYFIKW